MSIIISGGVTATSIIQDISTELPPNSARLESQFLHALVVAQYKFAEQTSTRPDRIPDANDCWGNFARAVPHLNTLVNLHHNINQLWNGWDLGLLPDELVRIPTHIVPGNYDYNNLKMAFILRLKRAVDAQWMLVCAFNCQGLAPTQIPTFYNFFTLIGEDYKGISRVQNAIFMAMVKNLRLFERMAREGGWYSRP